MRCFNSDVIQGDLVAPHGTLGLQRGMPFSNAIKSVLPGIPHVIRVIIVHNVLLVLFAYTVTCLKLIELIFFI